MRGAIWIFLSAVLALVVPPSAAGADFAGVDAILGRPPVRSKDVYRYAFPRGDLTVTLDGVEIEPALALGGWVAFTSEPAGSMAMGDLVLTEAEIEPVMKRLVAGGVAVTALHNHLLRATPATFYMHIAAHGKAVELAETIRSALERTKTPLGDAAQKRAARPAPALDVARIEQVIGWKGLQSGAVYQISAPRVASVSQDGVTVPPPLGIANAINFQSTGQGRAAIAGDLVARAGELQPLVDALLSHGVEITAIHNHMTSEEPRLFFVHFWANDDAVKLARALRSGLDKVGVAPKAPETGRP